MAVQADTVTHAVREEFVVRSVTGRSDHSARGVVYRSR